MKIIRINKERRNKWIHFTLVWLIGIIITTLVAFVIKSLAWYRCSTLMVPCATLSRYRSYHSLGTGTTEVI